ncbi:MAG: PAS domain-containing protein [Planctomycetes bacterium]|nr:PAS domain-containing protein [Planctomycetota bacterium]
MRDDVGETGGLGRRAREPRLDEHAFSKLEEARSQLALVVGHLPVVIYTCDAHDFRTTYVSPNVTEITGFAPEDLYADPGLWLARIHPEDRIAALTSCDEMQQLPFREVEYRWQRADGSWLWLLDVVRLVREEDGAPRHHAGVLLDITERRLTEDELRATREQARELNARLLCAREEEQRRVSRELHDELGQDLTAVRLDLETILRRTSGSDPELRTLAERALAGVDGAIRGVRRVAHQLRPLVLDDHGLAAGLTDLVERFRARSALAIELVIECDLAGLDDHRSTCLFRITQEALTNVVRHAEAAHARVHLRLVDGHLALTVDDDGKGVPDEPAVHRTSLGLAGLRERARLLGGMALVARRPEGGTRVDVRIPAA